MKKFAQLLLEIEKSRSEMHRVAAEKGFHHKEVLQISQRLDNLLNQYYKVKSGYKVNSRPTSSLNYSTIPFYPFIFREHTVVTFYSGINNYFYKQSTDADIGTGIGMRLSLGAVLLQQLQALTAQQNPVVN